MKMINKFKTLFVLLLCSSQLIAAEWGDGFVIGEPNNLDKGNLVEKKKSFTYSFGLEKNDAIDIDNHYGDVKFKYWEKAEVRFDVIVVANANSDVRADAFIDAVKITASKNSGVASTSSKLDCKKLKYEDNVNSSLNPLDRNYLKVNYTVYLPKGHKIVVDNANGDIYLPNNTAEIKIKQEHGVLYASNLENAANEIEVNYGLAYIKSISGGKLTASKMKVVIDSAKDLLLMNTFGEVKVNSAENVDFHGKYTSGYVGEMKQSCKFKIDYSNDFTLGEVDKNVKDFELVTSYSDVTFPMCRKAKFNMTVEAKNCDVEVAHEQVANALNCKKNKNLVKTVEVGTAENEPSNIFISANNGKVRIK